VPHVKRFKQFLADEGYTIVAEDTGGVRGRRLRFWPASGRVQMRYMIADDDILEPKQVEKAKPEGDVELF